MRVSKGQMKRLGHWLVGLEWLWVLLLLPLVLFPSPGRAVALLFVPLLWLGRKALGGRLLPRTSVDVAVLGMMLMVLISIWATPNWAGSFPKVIGVVYGVMVFYGVVGVSGRGAKWLWRSVLFLLANGTAIALLSLLATEWKSKVVGIGFITSRLPAPLIRLPGAGEGFNANEVAGVLLWVLPLLLALTVGLWRQSHTRLMQMGLLGASGLVGVVFLLLQSRAAYVGLFVAVLFLVLVALRHHRRVVWGLMGLGLIGVLALLSSGLGEDLLFSTTADVTEETFSLESFESRQEIWRRAVHGLNDFPLFGVGLNRFREVVPALYPLLFTATEAFDVAHAHNQWLQTGLDLGLPGLVFYGALWLGLVMMLWQSWQRHKGTLLGWLVVGLAANLLAFFVYGLIDTVALGARPGFLFWLFLGLIAGLHQTHHVDHEAELT